jgi:hypothetical protein
LDLEGPRRSGAGTDAVYRRLRNNFHSCKFALPSRPIPNVPDSSRLDGDFTILQYNCHTSFTYLHPLLVCLLSTPSLLYITLHHSPCNPPSQYSRTDPTTKPLVQTSPHISPHFPTSRQKQKETLRGHIYPVQPNDKKSKKGKTKKKPTLAGFEPTLPKEQDF